MLATTRTTLPTIGTPMNASDLAEKEMTSTVTASIAPAESGNGSDSESPFHSNPCKVKTSFRRYRNDPYQAQVVPETLGLSKPHQLPSLGLPHTLSAPAVVRHGMQLPALGMTIAHRFGPHAPSEGPTGASIVKADPFRRMPFASAASPASSIPHVPNLDAKPFVPNSPKMPITHRTRGLGPRAMEPQKGSEEYEQRVEYEQYVLVRFRRNQYTYGFNGDALNKDDTVVVQGDRGEHMGVIIDEAARKPKGFVGPVLRVATEDDLAHLNVVRRDELAALATCREFVENLQMGEQMSIADVEWQTDYQKLTVFFEPVDKEHFVDFRRLQRALFTHFRCRIWLIDA